MAEVREMTRNERTLASAEMSVSVMPSAKYSSLPPGEKSPKGNTTSDFTSIEPLLLRARDLRFPHEGYREAPCEDTFTIIPEGFRAGETVANFRKSKSKSSAV